jgi:hypothetical protein
MTVSFLAVNGREWSFVMMGSFLAAPVVGFKITTVDAPWWP